MRGVEVRRVKGVRGREQRRGPVCGLYIVGGCKRFVLDICAACRGHGASSGHSGSCPRVLRGGFVLREPTVKRERRESGNTTKDEMNQRELDRRSRLPAGVRESLEGDRRLLCAA